MAKFIVSFIDNGQKYVKVRTSRDFGRLSDALRFFDTLDKSREPVLEREYTVKETTFTDIVKQSFDLGLNDGKKNNIKKTEDEVADMLRVKDPNFWAYCEGYAKGKYNI